MSETSLAAVAEAAAAAAAPAAPQAPAVAAAAPAAPAAPAPAAPVAAASGEQVSASAVLESLIVAHPSLKTGLEPLVAKVKAGADLAAVNMHLLSALAGGQKVEMDARAPDNAITPPKPKGEEAKIDTSGIYAGRAAAVAGK